MCRYKREQKKPEKQKKKNKKNWSEPFIAVL